MYFLSNVPLKFVISNSVTKSCPLYNFKTVQDIFMKLNTNINQHVLDDMQRARTITLVLILFELRPFELCK